VSRITSGFIISLALLCADAGAQAVQYRIHDLSGIIGRLNEPARMGPNGEIVGTAGFGAFYWSEGSGKVDLPAHEPWERSGAKCVNSLGDIAGYSTPYAVVWRPDGSIRCLGMLPGASSSYANGINDLGQVVGGVVWRDDSGPLPVYTRHAVIWASDGTPTDLGQLFGPLRWDVLAINDSGLVLGYALASGGFQCWLRSPDGAYTYLDHCGGNYYVHVDGLNNSGLVVGTVEPAVGAYRATLWNPDGSVRSILEPLPGIQYSMGYGLNGLGEAVGESTIVEDGDIVGFHATLWGQDGAPVDLGTLPGHQLSRAWGIGDNGYIVGESGTSDGDWRIVLWTPVPEPGCLVSLSAALCALAIRARRRLAG